MRALASRCPLPSASAASKPASPTRSGSIWTRRWPEPARCQVERDGRAASIEADPAAWGDVILARKDSPTSYHLSVVVDDAAQGVTDVVRGQDLFAATAVHRVLQELLGLPAPRYRHHRLILDDEGKKLSKSTQATGLRELRAQGKTPVDICRLVGLA